MARLHSARMDLCGIVCLPGTVIVGVVGTTGAGVTPTGTVTLPVLPGDGEKLPATSLLVGAADAPPVAAGVGAGR